MKEQRIRKAVFPAAGLGTRFLPATKASPKEMLPLVDKPLIQYGVEEAIASGIDQIILVTGRGKTAIEDHFDVSKELEMLLDEKGKRQLLREVREISSMADFAYVRQKEALGLGHAILCARNLVGDEPFAVFLGDDVIDSRTPAMRQLIDVYRRHRATVLAVVRVPRAQISAYGVIDPERMGEPGLYRVRDLVEKPSIDRAPSELAVIGRYVLTPGIFAKLAETKPGKGGEIQLTDGLRALLADEPIYALEVEGERYDAGDKLGFLKATVSFAMKRPE
ncbi:MAG TPA: UTP--glucose-1-phosphate uridylyltransferase GalU, partial [Thermodesulfobacteriota bacterium]